MNMKETRKVNSLEFALCAIWLLNISLAFSCILSTTAASGASEFGGRFISCWVRGPGLTLTGCCCMPGGGGLTGTWGLTCGGGARYCPGADPIPIPTPPGMPDCCGWLGKPGTESRDCCCCWDGCAGIPGCELLGGPPRPGALPARLSCPPSRCRCCCCARICCNRSGGMFASG